MCPLCSSMQSVKHTTQENDNDKVTAVKEKLEKEGNKNTDTPKGKFPMLVQNGKIADDVQMHGAMKKKDSTKEGKGSRET